MDITQCTVQVAAKHFREPVINTGKHSKDRCHTHYNMEVRHHEHGIMQVNIDSRVTQEDTGQTTGNEQAYKTNRRIKLPGVNRILPLHNVVSQLNTLIAEGTAISSVSNTKTDPRNGFNPVTNIWCAHTRKARIAMANKEPSIAI